MNHHAVESELKHLESVAARVERGCLPASYWVTRLEKLGSLAMLPQQPKRLLRLEKSIRW
jgi:hypothetical protein